MDVFIAPFEVVDNPLVCQLFFYYEQILEKFDDSLIYIEMVKLGDHCLLILEVLLLLYFCQDLIFPPPAATAAPY